MRSFLWEEWKRLDCLISWSLIFSLMTRRFIWNISKMLRGCTFPLALQMPETQYLGSNRRIYNVIARKWNMTFWSKRTPECYPKYRHDHLVKIVSALSACSALRFAGKIWFCEYCCLQNFKSSRFPYPQRPSIGVADFFWENKPHFPTIIHRLSAKTRDGRHEMGANVYFKPLRDSKNGKVYWFPSSWSSYATAVRQKYACEEWKEGKL